MSDTNHYEKEQYKQEEKWYRDPVSSLVTAAILIWAGVVLLSNNLGYAGVFTNILESLPIQTSDLGWDLYFASSELVQVFFLGAGLIWLLEALVRLAVPSYRQPVTGTFILAVVSFAIALGNWSIIWPLVLIAIGLSVLLRSVLRKR